MRGRGRESGTPVGQASTAFLSWGPKPSRQVRGELPSYEMHLHGDPAVPLSQMLRQVVLEKGRGGLLSAQGA